MNPWTSFYHWYSKHVEQSQLVTLIILLSQVPHFVWGGDVLAGSGLIANAHPITDFILYGVDLLEIPLIIKVTVDYVVIMRKRKTIK